MTLSVRTVLSTPRIRPPTMTATTSAAWLDTNQPAAIRSSASSGRAVLITAVRAKRRGGGGGGHTEGKGGVGGGGSHTGVRAGPTPQPKKVRPMPIAVNPSGYGV